jgi:hypothetical protein
MHAATFTVSNPGNLAIQTEVWTLPLPAAKAAVAVAKKNGDIRPGSYWAAHLARPVAAASRRKESTVKLYTAGFSTTELCAILLEAGIAYSVIP